MENHLVSCIRICTKVKMKDHNWAKVIDKCQNFDFHNYFFSVFKITFLTKVFILIVRKTILIAVVFFFYIHSNRLYECVLLHKVYMRDDCILKSMKFKHVFFYFIFFAQWMTPYFTLPWVGFELFVSMDFLLSDDN